MEGEGLDFGQREGEVVFAGPLHGLRQLAAKCDGEGDASAVAADPGPAVGAEPVEMRCVIPGGADIAGP